MHSEWKLLTMLRCCWVGCVLTAVTAFLQGGTQRRVEKAEILEHTVLFLQNAADWDRNKAEGGGRGGRQHSFQDGFSECLQRATQFLGPQGEGERLGAALDASFAPRLARSVSVRMDAAASCSSSSLNHMKPSSFNLQISTQTSMQGQRIALKMRHLALSRRVQLQQRGSSKVARRQLQSPSQPEVRVQRITASLSDSQSPWRPWP